MVVRDLVYCIDESCYAEHITKRAAYEVREIDGDYIRFRSERGRLVWLPAYFFAKDCPPAISMINIDDVIEDPENDCVEVTISFSDGTKRWTAFATPAHLSKLMTSNDYVIGDGFIFLNYLNSQNIEKAIIGMDRKKERREQTRPL
jgi:hypothetical protein